ncbi:MAG: RNA 2'-phosphotransferase [Mucilaginibacter sp.]
MLTEKEAAKISKFLSLVLRHQPEVIGLILDENGWADVDELIAKCNSNGHKIDFATLKHAVETNNKKRFSFNDTFDKIRASQGHSVEIDLGYIATPPPKTLYHGTATKSVDAILLTGLEKRNRQHVHLSKDIETAAKVGQRHGKVFIFEVDAGQMQVDGFEFFISENGVWLTDNVPVKYLSKFFDEANG